MELPIIFLPKSPKTPRAYQMGAFEDAYSRHNKSSSLTRGQTMLELSLQPAAKMPPTASMVTIYKSAEGDHNCERPVVVDDSFLGPHLLVVAPRPKIKTSASAMALDMHTPKEPSELSAATYHLLAEYGRWPRMSGPAAEGGAKMRSRSISCLMLLPTQCSKGIS